MRINTFGDDSISSQARTYGEYRLFAALSQTIDTTEVRNASLVLRRAASGQREVVVCTVTVELNGGEVASLSASDAHPYAAINRVVERIRLNAWPARHDSTHRELAASE